MTSPPTDQYDEKEPAMVVIAGAGIVGLVLALALQKHVAITAEVYEKVEVFHEDVGVSSIKVLQTISSRSHYCMVSHENPPLLFTFILL